MLTVSGGSGRRQLAHARRHLQRGFQVSRFPPVQRTGDGRQGNEETEQAVRGMVGCQDGAGIERVSECSP
jgi:hypothetical protein